MDIPVVLTCEPYGLVSGRLENLSISGALVSTKLALPRFGRIDLTLEAPFAPEHAGERCTVRIRAYVVRQQNDRFGLEWIDMAPEAVTALIRGAVTDAPAQGPQQACA
jgi:hypothetical protein